MNKVQKPNNSMGYECFVRLGTLIHKQKHDATFIKRRTLHKLTLITGFISTVLLEDNN
jgi:hypothetical protein